MDLSRELRKVSLELRYKWLLEAFLQGKDDISGDLVFSSLGWNHSRPGQPASPLLSAGPDQCRAAENSLSRFETHFRVPSYPKRRTDYVKEQMGHSSIQATVDTYGHLIPGANVSFVDRLDTIAEPNAKYVGNNPQPPRNQRKSAKPRFHQTLLIRLVAAVGLEPTTYGL